MPQWRQAALNNAAWCDAVARAHGIRTELDDQAWIARSRTPPFYPDAVGLDADTSIPDLLRRIDSSPGCSVKDSTASLDLPGFRLLFEAQWIARRPGSIAGNRWERIRDEAELVAWEAAWSGHDAAGGIFPPALLALDSIAFLAAREAGDIVAGAVLTRSAEVVGVSNVFARRGLDPWTGCLATAAAMFPAATLVGYESGRDLDAALAHGFEAIGPLRVWMLD